MTGVHFQQPEQRFVQISTRLFGHVCVIVPLSDGAEWQPQVPT
jgi:hypothetical protein